MTTLPSRQPSAEQWQTYLELDFTNSSEAEVREHFDIINSTTSTNEAIYRDNFGSTWDVDEEGLHQILLKEDFEGYDKTYNYQSAKFVAKKEHTIVRYTVKAINPIGFHSGYVPALWAYKADDDVYCEYDLMEDPNKALSEEGWGEDVVQANIHYGRSSADKIQNKQQVAVQSEAGEENTYVLELNSKRAIISINGEEVRNFDRNTIYDDDRTIRPFWNAVQFLFSFYYGAEGWNDDPPWNDSAMPAHFITTYYKVEVLPFLPSGYSFLTDNNGYYLKDANGCYLISKIVNI